jgi:hypothetical protein
VTIKGNHPLAAIIAKCLFGINTVPPEYRQRMINRACREAVKWHEANKATVDAQQQSKEPKC